MSEPDNKSSKIDTFAWVAAIALAGLMVWAIVIPNLVKQPRNVRPCIVNLREFDSAKQQWALENGKTNGTVCTESDIKSYIKLDAKGNLPKCPLGGTYTIGKIGEPPTCSLAKNGSPHHKLP